MRRRAFRSCVANGSIITSTRSCASIADDKPPAEQDPAEAIYKYDNIPAEKLQYGHLVIKLLMMGPSLLTVWQGENVIPTLLTIKGKTQPVEAAEGSIRGGFWCDNGVCNLVHTSDDMAEAMHELAVLNLNHWLDEDADQAPLMEPSLAPTTYVAHSGISIVCNVVNRMLIADNTEPIPIHLPTSGNAQETNQQLTIHLREASVRYSDTAPFIEAFLAGDLSAVMDMLKSLPVTRWEYFVIQCGAVNRDRWNCVL